MSIVATFQRSNLLLIGIFSLFLVILALMVARVADDLGNARRIPWAVVIMAIAGILCTLYSVRFLRFAALFVSLGLPYAILWLQERMSQRRLLTPATFAIALLPFIAVFMVIGWISPTKRPTDTTFHILNDGCETADFSILHTVAPGRILAGPTLGIHIAYEAPERFTVSNIPFQRAATGIRRTLDTFLMPVAEMQPLQALDYDYVAICTPKTAISPADGSFYQALAMSVQIAGLQPLNDGKFRIYRIAR
jgi:MFS family permease